MAIPELSAFKLAGGTALALQIGHRESFDLDLFGDQALDKEEISGFIAGAGRYELKHQTRNILSFLIDDVKVDIVNYRYALLRPFLVKDEIRLLDLPDIAAMKLSAITGRGKKRDFTDLFFLLEHFSLEQIMNFYRQKYPDGAEFLIARSLTYFEDADQDEDMKLFKPAPWNLVKKKVTQEVKLLFGQ